MLVLGCDPGLTGALCLIDSQRGLLGCEDMPTCPNGTASGSMKRWLNAEALEEIVRDWSQRFEFAREGVVAVIERPIPMPTLPAQTIASQFDTFGVIRAVLARRVPVHFVNPRDWKKFYGIGSDKKLAVEKARVLFRDQAHYFARAKDHNRSESALIAHWYVRSAL